MSRIRTICLVLLCVEVAALLVWCNSRRPRILIVHSYDRSYAWTREVDDSMSQVLSGHRDLAVRRVYLDTKRHPWPAFKETSGLTARQLARDWDASVIVAIDDDAQQHMARHFIDAEGVRIVYAGVNNAPSSYGYDRAGNVTGVLERLPLPSINEALSVLRIGDGAAGPKRIAFIGDRSETVQGDARWVAAFDWTPSALTGTQLVDDLPAWLQAVDDASARADLILLSNYRRIARTPGGSDIVPAEELIATTLARSRVPVVGANAFFVTDGGALAIATAPHIQGELAARVAVRVAHGEAPAMLTPLQPMVCTVSMSGTRMQAARLSLPSIYEASARTSGLFLP